MGNRPPSPAPTPPPPPRRFRLWHRLYALGLAGLVMAGFGWGVWTLLPLITIQQSFELPGQMRRASPAIPVPLPDGAQILTILVTEGEEISQGQTIILLDPLPYEVETATLNQTLFRQYAWQTCLRQLGRLKDFTTILPKPGPGFQPSDALKTDVIARCKVKQQVLVLELQDLQQQAKNLAERLRLVERALDLNSRFALPADGAGDPRNTAQLRKILDLSLAKNLTEEDLQRAKTARRRYQTKHNQWITTELAQLAPQISEVEFRRNKLLRQSAALRIYAPVAGIARDIRKNLAGAQLFDREPALRIDPQARFGFDITFAVPFQHLAAIPIGSDLEVTLLGMPPGTPRLKGRITHFSYETAPPQKRMRPPDTPRTNAKPPAVPGFQIIGHLRLSPDSLRQVQNRGSGMSRMTGNVAVGVRLHIREKTLKRQIGGAVTALGRLRQITLNLKTLVWEALQTL